MSLTENEDPIFASLNELFTRGERLNNLKDMERARVDLGILKSRLIEAREGVAELPLNAPRSQHDIVETCDAIKKLLLEKNTKYGDSALNPKRVFSKASAVETILVRIDDKLSRISNTGFESPDEDTLQDLIGYLVLLKIALKQGNDVYTNTADGETRKVIRVGDEGEKVVKPEDLKVGDRFRLEATEENDFVDPVVRIFEGFGSPHFDGKKYHRVLMSRKVVI